MCTVHVSVTHTPVPLPPMGAGAWSESVRGSERQRVRLARFPVPGSTFPGYPSVNVCGGTQICRPSGNATCTWPPCDVTTVPG